uniref:RNA-dependent RNA polymerase n=1 Tax=Colletotrichum camelliae hypovirus 1 TaxID=3071075 RepID=A0AA51GH07_9VIRU|nr:RNA-dependent RNA polymerase [Colletotrichum camelliae hypovirus 1]
MSSPTSESGSHPPRPVGGPGQPPPSGGSRQSATAPTGSELPLEFPTKVNTPKLNELAWLGDAQLTLDLRRTCLNATGIIDGAWVIERSKNSFLRRYLIDIGVDVGTFSEHSCGQAFEYLYISNPSFRKGFQEKYGLLQSGIPAMTTGKVYLEKCWVNLFKGPVRVGAHAFGGEKFLTKRQLEQLALLNELSSNTFSVEQDGNDLHLVPGDKTASEIIVQMTKRQRLGGKRCDVDSQALPAKRVKTNLSPFSGVKPRRYLPCKEWHGGAATKERPPERPVSSSGSANWLGLSVKDWISEGERVSALLEAPPSVEPNVDDFIVGGFQDCWKALDEEGLFAFLLPVWADWHGEDDSPVSFSQFRELVLEIVGKGPNGPSVATIFWESSTTAETRWQFTLSAETRSFHLEKEGVLDKPLWKLDELADVLLRVPQRLEDFDVGLTAAIVLGTIGDVEPTLDVVAANHFSALTQDEDKQPYEGKFLFEEQGHGWCASDFLDASPAFAKALSDDKGPAKGTLRVTTEVWNEIHPVWGGAPKTLAEQVGQTVPGAFVEEVDSFTFWQVPERPIGNHDRKLPDDFVLVTHPDHIEHLKKTSPDTMALVETRSVPVDSKDFIKLGQDILEGGLFSLSEMKEMQRQLLAALKETMPIVEQSDLIYLVSGTTFHYFIGSLFPDKQVFEVCPVPREDNGVCPEFYLGHYAEMFSLDPRFGHSIGRTYNQWLTAPLYLKELEWEGEYKYFEPPKFHSVMPWAAKKWAIESPNVGFKPYDDFVRKVSWVEKEVILGYFSLGSCRTITSETKQIIQWLRGLPVKWSVDPRWMYLFEGADAKPSGFFPHSTGLAQFDWVVHHGGSGIVNTCLTVHVPQTILPQIGDQFIWRDALNKHTIRPFLTEVELRAHLYHDRLPARPRGGFLGCTKEQEAVLASVGAEPVEVFAVSLHCCHDWNEYGYKDLDFVVGQSDSFWFTLYDTEFQRTGKPGPKQLKWLSKECCISAPPVWGWRGTNTNATYPWHAHGWLGDLVPREGLDSMIEVPSEWLLWLANQSLTAKDKRLVRRSQRPETGICKRCQRTRELLFHHCSRCVGDIVGRCAVTGEIPDLPPFLKWSGNRLKGPEMSKPFDHQTSGRALQSVQRYFQLDSRMLDKAPVRRVARALMDKITCWEDTKWVEAFWWYTNSMPPHYKFKTNPSIAVEEMAKLHVEMEVTGLAQDVVSAIGNVLSISSVASVARRVVGRNVMSTIGRGVMQQKWHVTVDALRHFSEFVKQFDIQAMPTLIEGRFPQLPSVDCMSYIHYSRGVAAPIRSRQMSHKWIQTLNAAGSPLRIHLFSLKLPALGPSFGVFHAVVEYQGEFWELQQVAGQFTNITVSKWQPEATPDRPLVKTVVVSENVVGVLPKRLIMREFQGLDYKILADNCLVFANFLVYNLTGKVVPWRHFGVFGQELSFETTTMVRKWAVSHFWTDEQEARVSISGLNLKLTGHVNPFKGYAREPTTTGPKFRVVPYKGVKPLQALRLVEATIQGYDRAGPVDCPWEGDALLDLAIYGYEKFGLSSHIVSQALLKLRMSKIPTRKRQWNLLVALEATLRKFPSTRLAGDVVDLLTATAKLRSPLRNTVKPAWAPLLNITVPRHWFREKDRLVEAVRDPDNLIVGSKTVVKLDLPQIAARYKHYFEGVEFPKVGFKWVRPGEYEVGVRVPLRKNLPKMDSFTWALVQELQDMHPFELGIFSLRFGTKEMAERVTDRYFTGTFKPGTLIPENEQKIIADAIFENNKGRFANARLTSPDEVWRKWHKNYSAGFPFRFNEKGNAKRSELIAAAGGKQKFLQAIRDYIASPELFPTVSHAFIKDEVLPTSYIEREKIRTIIAQDPLNYYAEMAVVGDIGKRQDPASFSAVGVSPAHGELAALAEKHLAYKHHFAMDVTALDSTAALDAADTIKKLQHRSFENHAQFEKIKTLIDGTMDNLVASWIIDIHTGRARFKQQGFTTGHAGTTPYNTYYMEVMMIKAYHDITGRPYSQFYDDVKFSSFSDDNFWSTNLPKSVFSGELISEYWLSRGVQVRVEGASDDLSQLSFLAKRFSFDPAHLEEVRKYSGRDARVAIVHDVNRLLQKFSDYKKKNTVAYRWEKLVALQSNCAHLKDIYDKVSEYLDALEVEMGKRPFLRKFMKQHPRKHYSDIMQLMYEPKPRQQRLVLSTVDKSLKHDFLLWWDTLRVDIMAFDGTASTYARVLNQLAGLLEVGGLNVEDPGVFLRQPGDLPTDPEFTLEHHCWLLNDCPGDFGTFRSLLQKTPFSVFCRAEEFWAKRERFSVSEETANGLRMKVIALQAIYTVVAWLERGLTAVPVVGPMYKLFCSAKGMTERVYSRLNAMYYAMFGSSSLILSSMMPKDAYLSLKVVAFSLWSRTTSQDWWDFSGDLGQFQDVSDAAAKLTQDFQNLLFDLDFSVLVPRPDTGENKNTGLSRVWQALDHMDSVRACIDHLSEGRHPLVDGPTGCGKSTDFVVNLHSQFNTVFVCQPRRVLVRNSPVAQKRLYAGCRDSLTPGLINFGTAGYFRRALHDMPDDAILVIDEFHEMDEDSLWLFEKFKGRTICVTATPKFPNSKMFSPVTLTKSRVSGHAVATRVENTKGDISDVWDELIGERDKDRKDKVLVIVPTLRMVQELTRHAAKLAPSKRVCELYRGHDTVQDADWYFATSIVDAGLTIEGITCVIDCGWSLGWAGGRFSRRPSSHNVSDQRRGRTGRTCDGLYVRLIPTFDNSPWDFTTPFVFNEWHVASQWNASLKRPATLKKGELCSLPPGYKDLFENNCWSHLVYLTYYYANRGDLDRTRADYQSARKFPDTPDVQYVVGQHQNANFLDLLPLEESLRKYRIKGTHGNVWAWDGQVVKLEDFTAPIPRHLQDWD